ncbi:Glycosyltransferase type 1 [Halomicronema hongdechloris C2206]|uniref:Glycosyltransferase type 1 n=1 Tax=Halomicronema hongdechloris C2206 TaxID=1641165 RepID=A0A1Z3HMS9_9CYAN|nr:glycosyltransferase family 4 protein [Halomicronema hongdechloris]ASC71576.1 Glycosyltransferase type 1 [Halomicronema hongdechloris C2206]
MMGNKKLRILLIIEQCNPEWTSVPLQGYYFYISIRNLFNTTLVTHERNKPALEKVHSDRDIVYIYESNFTKWYYKHAESLSKIKGKIIWPLYNTLTYPIYAEFNHLVYKKFKTSVLKRDYDIVHVVTPMMPRYPAKIIKACKNIPFIIGPVNGGVPYPKGFQEIARKEFAGFNFLRLIGRWLIPGYRETYEEADYILAGSTYTLNLIKSLFDVRDEHIELFYENGINDAFFSKDPKVDTEESIQINLLFVGRLVPYKGADILIDSIGQLRPQIQENISLIIVGNGSEKESLQQQVQNLDLKEKIHFPGWVNQQEILEYYHKSDIFCFPSVREFGGAVVIEAMANGLPCIVVDNGGIGEYVTEETGFKINPISREFVVQELRKRIEQLVEDRALHAAMSYEAVERAKEFTWDSKAEKISDIYLKLLSNSSE